MFSVKMSSQKSGPTASYATFYALFQITGILLICCVYYWIVNFRGGFSFTEAKIVFNWHPLLMTIAFIYLFANSILHYRTFRNSKKQNLKNQHAIIHGCIIILILIAACAALISHEFSSPPIANLYTMHSWLGLVTVLMFLSQFASGLVFFLYPGMDARCKETAASYHVFFGIVLFVFAIATAVLGFSEKLIFALDKKYRHYPAEGVFGNFLGLLCVFYGVLVVYMVTKPEFKRRPQLEYEQLL